MLDLPGSLSRKALSTEEAASASTHTEAPSWKPNLGLFSPQLPTICHGEAAPDAESALLPCPIRQLLASPIPYRRHLLLLLLALEGEIATGRSQRGDGIAHPFSSIHPNTGVTHIRAGLGLLPWCLAPSRLASATPGAVRGRSTPSLVPHPSMLLQGPQRQSGAPQPAPCAGAGPAPAPRLPKGLSCSSSPRHHIKHINTLFSRGKSEENSGK